MSRILTIIISGVALVLSGQTAAFAITGLSAPHMDYRVFSTTNTSGYSGGCSDASSACHTQTRVKFLPANIDMGPTTDFTRFCLSCHNKAGEAHDRSVGSHSTLLYNRTAFNSVTGFSGSSHSWNGVVGNAGTRTPPTLGTGHMPGGNEVTCQVCHEGMGKITGEENIDWASTTDTSDHKGYLINNGAVARSNTRQHLAQYIRVYRSASVATRPTNSRTKKLNLVKPSEYTYNPRTATVTFGVSQGTNKIYVDIGQPYLRMTNQSDRMCLDCHADRTGSAVSHGPGNGAKDSHPVGMTYGNRFGIRSTLKQSTAGNVLLGYTTGAGDRVLCTTCHGVHNADSRDGKLLREADATALCLDCHDSARVSTHKGKRHLKYANTSTIPTGCAECHSTHNTTNVYLVRDKVKSPDGVTRGVSFRNLSGPDSFGMDTGSSICEACHSRTGTHKYDGSGKNHHAAQNCLKCHKHENGFAGGGGGGGGSKPCYNCHDGSAVDIKALMGLGTSVMAGGKPSKHRIAFDNASTSSCLTMCHTDAHETGSPNLNTQPELSLCASASCHNGGTGLTTAGKSISVAGSYTASLHNYSATTEDETGLFRYSANCSKCHVPHGSDVYPNLRSSINGSPTNGNSDDLCFGCHNGNRPHGAADIKDIWTANPSNKGHYDYQAGRQLPCKTCHGPHGTQNDSMISDLLGGPAQGGAKLTRDAICRVCHSGRGGSSYNVMGDAPGSYKNFSAASMHNFGWNVAIGGHTVDLTCVGCHDPHNTKNARLIQDKVLFSGYSTVRVNPVSAVLDARGSITSYTGGWGDYCAICHSSVAVTGGQSPYRRHPVGMAPGSFYPHTTAFGMRKLPLESGSVSCITCHYTHGSPKPSLQRIQSASTPENRLCLQCHDNDSFMQGGAGSHGGFIQNQGRCRDCHNMHTKANKKLLTEGTESVLCKACHSGGPGSKYNVWMSYTTTANPLVLKGTGGTFGRYSEVRGGSAHSMHSINEEANPAPGGVTTEHRCGTCHNPHGSKSYRILRRTVNNVTGIDVYARTDEDGTFINYSTGLVKFCSACHTAYTTTDDGSGNWIRHPVGVRMSGYSTENANFNNSTSYKPKVELESGGTVSCVTCHFAHGSGADANLKFPGGKSVNACKTCHSRTFGTGTPGSHAGYAGNDGSCSDCHSMHAEGNAKLLKADAETAICVNCHDNPGTSASSNPSHMDVWKGNTVGAPSSWYGTAGSFGSYDPVNGGNAPYMHPVNSEARQAPGDSYTVVHCGTCHDAHGSRGYRLLRTNLNGKGGILVLAGVDSFGNTTSYHSGMSGFCTACHKAYINYGTSAGYTRHPVDVALSAAELNHYKSQNGGSLLPLESGNKVTCTTCHFAHGGPNPAMKRMPGNQMCQICHAKGLDPANGYQEVKYPHGGFENNAKDCTVCHVMHSGNNRKLLVMAEETDLCYSCHGPGGAGSLVWKGDAPPTPTAWDGTGGSFGAFNNASGGTIRSHHSINKTDTPAPGGTTTDHRCGTCHNPHGNNNFRMLRDDANGGSGINVKANVMGRYSTGMSSFCTACHSAYGDTGSGVGGYRRHPVNKMLSAQGYSNLSGTLLEPKAQVEGRKVMCLSCHFAHGSPANAMLRMRSYTSSESELCQQCHKKGYNSDGQQVRYTHGGFNGNRSNCRVCHTVHSKNNQKLLMEPKESQLCDNCHAGIAKFNAFRAEDADVKITAPSRFNVFSSIGNSFGNYSVGGGDVVSWHEVDGTHSAPGGKTLELRCGKCHNPHGSDNFVMIRDTVEGVTGIKVFGHVSSTGPFNTYSSGFASFCSACHSRLNNCGTGNPWTRHPVDFKLKDTQYENWSATGIMPRVPLEAGRQVTCITCHNSHGSKNYSLQRMGGNGMCQQCHKR